MQLNLPFNFPGAPCKVLRLVQSSQIKSLPIFCVAPTNPTKPVQPLHLKEPLTSVGAPLRPLRLIQLLQLIILKNIIKMLWNFVND